MDLNERIQSLKNERSELLNNLEANLDATESADFDAKMSQADDLKAQIEKFEKLNAEKAVMTPIFDNKDGQNVKASFDFARFIQNGVTGKLQDGAEKEIIDETKDFYRNAGLNASGATLPFELFNAHTAGAANNGAELVETIKSDRFIDALQPYSVLQPLGANILTGLSGNIDFGAITNAAAPGAKGETADADDYTATIVSRSLNPQRGAIETTFSNSLMNNTSYNVRQILSRHLLSGVTRRSEEHAVAEVLANAGTTVAIGTNGGAITYAKAVELMNSLNAANASGTNNAFVTNAKVREAAMKILLDSGSGRYLWEHTTPNQFLGERAVTTNYAPSNLSKGTGSNLSGLIYGDFTSLTVGFWGGLDIVFDNVTMATSGQLRLIVNFFHDSMVEIPENFGVIKDIDA